MRADAHILEGKTVKPADFKTWGLWFEANKDNRHVGKDHVGEILVSTVFLGLDHNHDEEGPPIVFETMVFGGALDGEMARYCTWEDAEKGHAEILARVQAAGS